jgi:hypothetical protein
MEAGHIVSELGFLLFDTPIGACGIVWGDRGVVAVQLPDASEVRRMHGSSESSRARGSRRRRPTSSARATRSRRCSAASQGICHSWSST